MNRTISLPLLALFAWTAIVPLAHGQQTPYIGFVYPAGGQQGATSQIRLGGQRIDGVSGAMVSGEGVSAKLAHYYRRLSNQEVTLLREQLKELKPKKDDKETGDGETQELAARIEQRIADWVNRPACVALSSIAVVEMTIAPDARPGPREIRLITPRGVTNAMAFHVGQLPEVARKPMRTCLQQTLGKEQLAQRKRPPEEEEVRVGVPCTMNGQIASGEVNRYRFQATKGQRLVVSVAARQLIPFIADAVPGWFQPVISLHDSEGTEVAFNDDYRYRPDPTLYYEVPRGGEFVLSITDAIFRGREDFVYRITLGEVPFVTSIFPLGAPVDGPVKLELDGWNLKQTELSPPSDHAGPGVQWITTKQGGYVSNRLPFARDTLPECLDEEPNDDPAHAQEVKLPIIVNGRIDRPDDWDVFKVEGRAGERIVAEVHGRRLDSPIDSMLKVTDSAGKLLAINDDHHDLVSGANTHHADSYLAGKLPKDGAYYVHLGDTARHGGPAYAYRLRISRPRPDFALRVVPSSAAIRSKGTAAVSVYALRKEGFAGPIKLSLKDPLEGFPLRDVVLPKGKQMVRFPIRSKLTATEQPVHLTIEGRAMIAGQEVVHAAVAAEDRMQAFLWRHLVPAEGLAVLVYDPSYTPPAKRTAKPLTAEEKAKIASAVPAAGLKFTERQVAGRLRQLKNLFEEYLLTDEFYNHRVAECEAVLSDRQDTASTQ